MLAALLTALLLFCAPAHAHREDVSYLVAVSEEGRLVLSVEVSWMDLLPEGAEPPADTQALLALGPKAHALVAENLELSTRAGALALGEPVATGTAERAGGLFVQLRYEIDDPRGDLGVDMHLFDAFGPQHKTVARVHRGERPEYAVFDVQAPRFRFAARAE